MPTSGGSEVGADLGGGGDATAVGRAAITQVDVPAERHAGSQANDSAVGRQVFDAGKPSIIRSLHRGNPQQCQRHGGAQQAQQIFNQVLKQ